MEEKISSLMLNGADMFLIKELILELLNEAHITPSDIEQVVEIYETAWAQETIIQQRIEDARRNGTRFNN